MIVHMPQVFSITGAPIPQVLTKECRANLRDQLFTRPKLLAIDFHVLSTEALVMPRGMRQFVK